MKTRLGIVGPYDSVERMSGVAEEFKDKLILYPFTYTDATETERIVKNNNENIDIWLFSGQAPYAIAVEAGLSNRALFPALNGSSLMKALLYITYHDQLKLEMMSLDTITETEVEETFSELQLSLSSVKLFSYKGYKTTEALTKFHYDLFKNNQTKIAITCVHAVYKALKSLNVPVYRVTPTKMILRQTIKAACQQNETLYFKRSQIAVIIIQINDMDKLMEEKKLLTYHHRLSLRLQEWIIDFSEDILGSYIVLSDGKFMIFSTRGALDDYEKYSITALLEKISLTTKLTSNMGIGYGKTSMEAERNAYSAFNRARSRGENCAMLVDENGTIEGPFKESDSITYSSRTDNKDLQKLLSKAGVNISTFNKILYVQNNISNHTVSTADIAEWLHMTQRNARRILTDLKEHGLAEELGQEASANRGRPRKIYRISYNEHQ